MWCFNYRPLSPVSTLCPTAALVDKAHCLVCAFSSIGHVKVSTGVLVKVEKTWFQSVNFRLLSHLYRLFVAFCLTSPTRGFKLQNAFFCLWTGPIVHRIQGNVNQSLNHWGCPALLHLTQPAVTLCLCTERKVLLHLASNKLHVLGARLCYGGRFMTLVNVTEQVRPKIWGKSWLVLTIKSAAGVNFTSHEMLCENLSALLPPA